MQAGIKVKMVGCYEAKQYPDKVWVTRSDSWYVGSQEVILLDGKVGGFAVSCLEEVFYNESSND